MFKLDEGVDTGLVVAQEVLSLAADETATTLYQRVTEAHRTLIASAWIDLVADTVILQEQDESQSTEWPGRKPEDGVILSDMDCSYVDRLVRAVTHPYPGAFIDFEGKRYTIWAGHPRPGQNLCKYLTIDQDSHLWLRLSKGSFEATTWEVHSLV